MALVKDLLRDERIVQELNKGDYKTLRYLAALGISRETPYDAMNVPINGFHWFHVRQVKDHGEGYGLKIERYRRVNAIFNQLEKMRLVKSLTSSVELKVGKPYAITDAGYGFVLQRLIDMGDELDRRREHETMSLLLSKNPLYIPRGVTEVYLESDKPVTVGRLAENDWSFPKDKAMSRRHARVAYMDGKPWIEDLNSTNGTWKLDETSPTGRKRVQTERINDGDEFQLGNTLIRFLLKNSNEERRTKASS